MPNQNDYVREFNRRLGNFTGSRLQPTPENVLQIGQQNQVANAAARFKMAQDILKAQKAKKDFEYRMNEMAAGDGTGRFSGLSDDTVDVLTSAENEDWDKSEKTWRSVFGLGGPLNLIPGAEKAWDAVGIDPLTPAKGILEGLSRVYHTPQAGLREYFETRNEGENPLESLDNVAKGMWGGVTGEDKSGFGDVVEQLARVQGSENPLSGDYTWTPENAGEFGGNIGYIFRNIDRLSPFSVGPLANDPETQQPKSGASMWARRGAGLAGELALDPLNAVGGGVITRIAGKTDEAAKGAGLLRGVFGGSEKGAEYTPEIYRGLVDDSVRRAVNSRGWGPAFRRTRIAATGQTDEAGRALTANSSGFIRLNNAIDKAINDVMLTVGGGSTRGRTLGVGLAPQSISSKVAEEVRRIHFEQFDKNLARYEQHLFGRNVLTKTEIADLRKTDPIFNAYVDELIAKANGTGGQQFKTIDDVLDWHAQRGTALKVKGWSREAVRNAKQRMNKEFEDIQKEIYEDLVGRVYNTPGIRIGSKTIPFDRMGRAYEKANREVLTDSSTLGKFSFNRQFPGRSALMNQKIRSTGMRAYETFYRDVKLASKGFTKNERKQIQEAIVHGNSLIGNPKLLAAAEWIKARYKEMWDEEIAGGVRAPGSKPAENYVYNYYRPGVRDVKNKAIKKYKDSHIKDNVFAQQDKLGQARRLPDDFIDEAKKRGLNPEEDAFRALLHRKLKSNRLLTKSWFTRDLLDHYGFMGNNLTKGTAGNRALSEITANLDEGLRADLKAAPKGTKWYLPDDIKEIFNNYNKLATGTFNDDVSSLIRLYDKLLRMFKFGTTIPYPGFHIRNAIGDIWMSHMDGVKYNDYQRLMTLWKNAGDPNKSKIFIGDRHWSFEDLKDMFRTNASSGGFYKTDLQSLNPGGAIRKGSELREDFFRFAHFLKAFRDEYPNALKSVKNKEQALQTAKEAATYRVNKHLFDYGALTGTERNVMRRIFPFYTYSRKVMPTLIEGLFLRPDQMSKTYRLFLEDGDDLMSDMISPDYLREIGFSKLSDEEEDEPWVLSGGFLPTDVLNRNTNLSSNQSLFGNILSQMSPIAKLPIELNQDSLLFNDQEIKGDRGYFQNSFMPLTRDLGGAFNWAVRGEPPKNKSGLEAALSERTSLGLPFNKLSLEEQEAALYDTQSEVYQKLEEVNSGLEKAGIRIILSKRKDGTSYRVRNESNDRTLYDTKDLNEAISRAKSIASNR